jgi:hypothetical protein
MSARLILAGLLILDGLLWVVIVAAAITLWRIA